jgi:glycosyltransferase involved in cell wall biosynthesis
VVAPVYNVENYFVEFIESVINQTYKKLQIILVDDGSTDNSGFLCDEYAKKDCRITVVHQENQGAGAAKNTGLDLVKGEYFSIIDSDDYLELNMYERMLNSFFTENCDVVQCMFYNAFVNNKYPRQFNFQQKNKNALSSQRFLYEMIYDWKYRIFWNKLFKTSLLQDIRFPVGRKIDDEFFTYKLICNAKKIVNINDCLYNYRMRKSSVVHANSKNVLLKDMLDCFIEREEYISQRYPNLKSILRIAFSSFVQENYDELLLVAPDFMNNHKECYTTSSDSFFEKLKYKLKMRNYKYDKDIFDEANVFD